jgi:hypothetical protein
MPTLYDLPENCSELVEGIELITVAEKLSSDNNYNLRYFDDGWLIDFRDIGFEITIPKVVTKFNPPSVKISIDKLKSHNTNLELFEREIKAIGGIVIVKNDNYRNFGYINMGWTSHSPLVKPNWQFMLAQQDKIYQLYTTLKTKSII